MRKKLAVILLSLVLAVSGVCTTAFALEDDITGHWSAPYFQSLSHQSQRKRAVHPRYENLARRIYALHQPCVWIHRRSRCQRL